MKNAGIILCILALLIAGFSNSSKTSLEERVAIKQAIMEVNKQELEEAKKTIKSYIKALNDNNYNELLRHLSITRVQDAEYNRIYHNIVPKYEYARIIEITPDGSEKSQDAYLKYGRGTLTKPKKLAIFKVEWVYKLTPNGIDDSSDKKVNWKFVLIKKQESDDWKIDDFGY